MARIVRRTEQGRKPNCCLIAFVVVAGLLLFGVVKLFYDVVKGPERSIALADSWQLADSRRLGDALETAYGGGTWESTPNKAGFIVSWGVPGLPEFGAGCPPSFWVELKPPQVTPWLGYDGELCDRLGIQFRDD